MRCSKRFFGIIGSAIIMSALVLLQGVQAQHRETAVTHMSTPFGSLAYNQATAFEEVFKSTNSWVKWKAQETPGALYIVRYMVENDARMKAGEIPHVGAITSVGSLPFLIDGRPPFDAFSAPKLRAVFSMPAFVNLFVTFNPDIKTLKDLEGKKVGIAEKSRPFSGTLLVGPYFKKGLKNYDKIDWQFLGPANSKDALLNNKIDVHLGFFSSDIRMSKDGAYHVNHIAPGPAEIELMNSGRKLYFLSFDPEIFTKSHDFSSDMINYPALIKKGTIEGVDYDLWARISPGIVMFNESLEDAVIQEIIRVRHEKREEFAAYHNSLKLLPEDPYPIGTPDHLVHPGVKKGMKNLGIPLPGE